MRGWTATLLLLMLAACDRAPQARDAGTPVADPVDLELPVPGRYESATSAQFTLPGEGMQQIDRTDEMCITGSGKEGVEAALKEEFNPICVSGAIDLDDGRISGQMTCRIAELRGAESVVSFSGNYDRDSIDLALDTSMGQASVRQTRPYRRVGAC